MRKERGGVHGWRLVTYAKDWLTPEGPMAEPGDRQDVRGETFRLQP